MKDSLLKVLKAVFPFVLGGGILYWMYRDFPFAEVKTLLLHQMRWEWMLLSFVPGVLAQVFRAARWCQTLEPLGEKPRMKTSVWAIFLSYAASLVVPRSGEFLRCGVLAKKDGTSFAKALGTVVTERIVDSGLMLVLVMIVFAMQYRVFLDFFDITGTNFGNMFQQVTLEGVLVTLLCGICVLLLGIVLWKKMGKVRGAMKNMLEGIGSLKGVKNLYLYIIYSVGIWVSYFLHYYLTFQCFDFTRNLGLMAGLVSFCVGTVAVIVPTPNGAGPWHFAVKTILIMYGLTGMQAISFVLIVHSVQTLLLVGLGVMAMAGLRKMKVKSF